MLQQQDKLLSQKGKRILLIDDEPDTCMEDADFEYVSYTDPVKALKEFRPIYYY